MKSNVKEMQQATFKAEKTDRFKQQAYYWAANFEVVCYLDSNDYPQQFGENNNCLVGVGKASELLLEQTDERDGFDLLKQYHDQEKDWLFGFLTYDLKNDIEKLKSENQDGLGFPKMHFFNPLFVLKINEDKIEIYSKTKTPETIYKEIQEIKLPRKETPIFLAPPNLQSRISKEEYLKKIKIIHNHLSKGDIYEMNFCQEFYAKNCFTDPAILFQKLNKISKAPFSAYYRQKDQYLLSASPERFLKKIGSKLISQPIKGTIKRGTNPMEDRLLGEKLQQSQKDRSENVMIVDLVRNDLAKSCQPGSVQVEELFKIYSFEQVHQMISTVSGQLNPTTHFVDAIKNAFPMGSMTGAPKVRSMKLIERYEQSLRGLYSGAVGYITPEGDFDFNVVIRSILYNESRKYLSFQVGGAIVYDSVAEQEFDECLLKAKGIMKALGIEN